MSDNPSPTRYWVLKDNEKNILLVDPSSGTPVNTTWVATADLSVQPNDIAYFWRQEDSSYFYGWGTFVSRPDDEERLVDVHLPDIAYVDWTIRAYPIREPITMEEVEEAQVRSLRLRDPRVEFFEIDKAEAAALNRLIRKHGVEAPDDPILPSPDESQTLGDDQPTDVSVNKLLEWRSSQFSILTREILHLAGQFANQSEQHPDRVTTSCLFFAAVELGPLEEGAQPETASQFLFQWLRRDRVTQYERAFEAFINPRNRDRQRGVALLTMQALRVVELAGRVAAFVRTDSVTEDGENIYARDLVGALLITMTTDERSGVGKRLRRVDINVDLLRRDYFDHYLISDKNRGDDLERWQKILIELEPVPEPPPEIPIPEIKPQLPAIDSDAPSLIDYLNIGAEVHGFANIIAARDVKTPLSIGLFGDWGSGKSTFMEQLQRTVEGIATEVREKPADQKSVFLGNIVQIKFNAWHYVEANLWASLVSHIFDNLSFSEQEEKEKAEKRKQLFLSKLSATLEEQRKVKLQVRAKQDEYQRAQNDLREARRQEDTARVKLSQILRESIWPEVKRLLTADPQAAGEIDRARQLLSQNELSEEELRRELHASRNTVGRIQWRLKVMMDDPRRGLIIVAIFLAALLAPIGLAFLVAKLVGSQLLAQTIAGITPLITLLAGALTWLRSKRGAADAVLNQLDKAEKKLDEVLVKARTVHALKVQNLQKEVTTAEGEINTATQRVKDLDKEKTIVLNTLREMEPGRVLESFVQERASSNDYRKLLGVVALIRRDFKKLSDMLREQDSRELRDSVAEILKQNQEQVAEGAAPAPLDVQLAAAAVSVAQQAKNEDTEAAPAPQIAAVAKTEAMPGTSAAANHKDPAVTAFEQRVEETLKDYRIDRIVLYIDDLDRCPPKQVVDVLQAIHLLLAFELFVVVVGVDARWVRHALRKRYPEMLDEDPDDQLNGKKGTRWTRAATPRDYVEKIFQIPFWIKPMEPGDSEKLFKGLIPDNQLAPIPTEETRDVQTPLDSQLAGDTSLTQHSTLDVSPSDKKDITEQGDIEPAKTGLTGSSEKEQSGQRKGEDAAEPNADTFDLSPASLLLDVNERNLMVAMGTIIGKSPRTVKRFINIYRIIKAGLDAKRLAAFMGTNGRKAEYPAVLVLLSVAHGQPEVTPIFFQALKLDHKNKTSLSIKIFLEKEPSANQVVIDEDLKENWDYLVKQLRTFCDQQKTDISLKTLNKWLPVILRYTFQLGRLSGEITEG
jgi:hypothetical protein